MRILSSLNPSLTFNEYRGFWKNYHHSLHNPHALLFTVTKRMRKARHILDGKPHEDKTEQEVDEPVVLN
jgi:hypothetical protein